MTLVVSFESMDDENSIKHFEARHPSTLTDMGLWLRPEPDRPGSLRRFRAGKTPWNLFHSRLHAQAEEHGSDLGHTHEEAS